VNPYKIWQLWDLKSYKDFMEPSYTIVTFYALNPLPRIGVFFLVCCATTQLAFRLYQEQLQVVCSDKEAQKRLIESSGTSAMDLGV